MGIFGISSSWSSKTAEPPAEEIDILHKSALVDPVWYRQTYPDLRDTPVDVARHYLERGAAEGRNPGPFFDANFYLGQNADVVAAGMNPLVHYIQYGAKEARDPHPQFGADWYQEQVSRLRWEPTDPLLRYMTAALLHKSALVDPVWCRQTYPELGDTSVDVARDYLERGAAEGRNPGPFFDTNFYLGQNPDVFAAGMNPLVHYIQYGAKEARDPHPQFGADWYQEQLFRLRWEHTDPLLCYMTAALLHKSALVDPVWYRQTYPDLRDTPVDVARDYLERGAAEGRNPGPFFDTNFYLGQNPDVVAAGINPLVHYIVYGAREGRDPHPVFDTKFYLEKNPEVVASDINPLAHYVLRGAKEGRDPHPLFDSRFYLEQNPDVAASGMNPLAHYMQQGAKEGRDPHPLFGTTYYLEKNPHVAASGMNRLAHYIQSGAREGRDPNFYFDNDWDDSTNSDEIPYMQALDRYGEWRRLNDPGEAILALQRRQVPAFQYQPRISVIVPVYKVQVTLIHDLIQSIQTQTYPNWELCIALAWLEDESLTRYLQNRAKRDPRLKLKVLQENGGISRNSNAALAFSEGEFIGLLDHDDALSPDALFEMVRALNEDPEIDFLYSDKDTMDESGHNRLNPLFKPAWSPELMLSVNYLTHFNLMRASRVREIGGWDPSTDGAQDWDIFLRFIGKTKKVHAIRRPLYHWRIIATSVASGLGAKPWAADAQLRTVTRYLEASGCVGAVATFAAENIIRVEWNRAFEPSVLIFVIGDEPAPNGPGWSAVSSVVDSSTGRITARYLQIGNIHFADEAAQAVKVENQEILMFIDDRCSPQDGWLTELLGPLQNEAIVAVGGRLENSAGELMEGGWVFPNGKPVKLFRGETREHWGIFAGAWCCRNHLAVSGSIMALRRSAFDAVGGFAKEPAWKRYDLDLGIKISSRGLGRIMLNTYACAKSAAESIFDKSAPVSQEASPFFLRLFPDGDPFFHPSLIIAGEGRPDLRLPPPPHRFDFFEEAKYCAGAYDASARNFTAPIVPKAAKRAIRSVAWFVPDFQVAFYGGIHTILRAAEYMRVKHDIHPIFVALGARDPELLRATISRAFPELAKECEIRTIQTVDIPSDLVEADAAVATLWVTAYALLRLKDTTPRFYFVQDYEPLFYPAGTTYGLAEATYRFGFHGVCNTYPLRELYEQHGGLADHFLPAVDTSVFHCRGRAKRNSREPFLLFSYARPGHPRNCFEVVAEGLIELKRRMKDRLRIITAGAEWNPKDHGLSGIVEHMGLLSYQETGKLYRSVDAGIVAMATCHPSYLPFELMACGALVATNRNRHTTWLLKDQENCVLYDLTRSAIADTVESALEDTVRLEKITRRATRTIAEDHSDWDQACEAISSAILRETDASIRANSSL